MLIAAAICSQGAIIRIKPMHVFNQTQNKTYKQSKKPKHVC